MKVITEAILRDEFKHEKPEIYYINEDSILSPAGKEYLSQHKVKTIKGNPPTKIVEQVAKIQIANAKYIDNFSGAGYTKKPEHMTQLIENRLVNKDNPRIIFRGKLDSLQSLIVLNQAFIAEKSGNQDILNDLDDILNICRNIMRAEVLEEVITTSKILGFTHSEIRTRSHNPQKFYNKEFMSLPSYKKGLTNALLNQIRSAIRECEIQAVIAYKEGLKYGRSDIIEELNRLSSALHIMMMKY